MADERITSQRKLSPLSAVTLNRRRSDRKLRKSDFDGIQKFMRFREADQRKAQSELLMILRRYAQIDARNASFIQHRDSLVGFQTLLTKLIETKDEIFRYRILQENSPFATESDGSGIWPPALDDSLFLKFFSDTKLVLGAVSKRLEESLKAPSTGPNSQCDDWLVGYLNELVLRYADGGRIQPSKSDVKDKNGSFIRNDVEFVKASLKTAWRMSGVEFQDLKESTLTESVRRRIKLVVGSLSR